MYLQVNLVDTVIVMGATPIWSVTRDKADSSISFDDLRRSILNEGVDRSISIVDREKEVSVKNKQAMNRNFDCFSEIKVMENKFSFS